MSAVFSAALISNRGGRQQNEDSTASSTIGGTQCWIIADGLGGHSGGEEASRITCETIRKSFLSDPRVSPEAVRSHFRNADDALRREQHSNPELSRMRSTTVVLVANASHAVVGHVGDSRFYYFRAGKLCGQTKDHSVPQSLVDAGELSPEAIRHHEDRSRLLHALGEEQPVRCSVSAAPLNIGKGDAFLLCTDGFWENVFEVEMELDLCKSRNPVEWLAFMESRLQGRVEGEYDNYTAIGIRGDALAPHHAQPALSGNSRATGDGQSKGQRELLLKLLVLIILPVSILAFASRVVPRAQPHLEQWVPGFLRGSHSESRPPNSPHATTPGAHHPPADEGVSQ